MIHVLYAQTAIFVTVFASWFLHRDRQCSYHIHERALRIAYKDFENDFGFLLEQSKSVPIQVRNLQLLMTANL